MKKVKSFTAPTPATSQSFTSKAKAPSFTSYPKSPKLSTTSAPLDDDADEMMQSKKTSARRFGIHAPHASSAKPPKGL